MLNHRKTSSSLLQFYSKTHHQPAKHCSQKEQIILSENSPSIFKRISTTDVHTIASEMKQSPKKVNRTERLKKLTSFETMEATIHENIFTNKKNPFLKYRMEAEYQRQPSRVEEQQAILSKEQREELDYVTIRLIRQDEKISRSNFNQNPPLQDSQEEQQ